MIPAGQTCFSDHTANTSFNLDRTEPTIFPFNSYKHTLVASRIQSLNLSFLAINLPQFFFLVQFQGMDSIIKCTHTCIFSHAL